MCENNIILLLNPLLTLSDELKEFRCVNCGALLFKIKLKDGIVERKCDKCGTMNKIESTPQTITNRKLADVKNK